MFPHQTQKFRGVVWTWAGWLAGLAVLGALARFCMAHTAVVRCRERGLKVRGVLHAELPRGTASALSAAGALWPGEVKLWQSKHHAGRQLSHKPRIWPLTGIVLACTSQTGNFLGGKPLAGKSLAGKPLAGKPLVGVPLAGKHLAGRLRF